MQGLIQDRPLLISSLIEFAVRDTGLGIAPEQHRRIFDAFSQADSSPLMPSPAYPKTCSTSHSRSRCSR